MRTRTHTLIITNTKIAIAAIGLFAAGGLALAATNISETSTDELREHQLAATHPQEHKPLRSPSHEHTVANLQRGNTIVLAQTETPSESSAEVNLEKQYRLFDKEIAVNSGDTTAVTIPDPIYGKSIAEYSYIQMSVKATPNPGTTLPSDTNDISFSILGDPYASNAVPLNSSHVVLGSPLDDVSYKTVRIPISELAGATNAGALSFIQILQFTPSDSSTYSLSVKDIYAVDTTPNDVAKIEALSSRVIKLVAAKRYDPSSPVIADPKNYTLTSDDPDFANGVNPSRVGREMHVKGFERSTGGSYGNAQAPIVEPAIFLVFDSPMKEGLAYSLQINDIPDTHGNSFPAPKTASVSYQDSTVTGSVQANQVGYLPDAKKYAYIGNYLGDAGSLPDTPAACDLHDASNDSVVATFPATRRGANAGLIGNAVFSCDFSLFTNQGSYYITVSGFGSTYPFDISPTVYNDIFRKLSDLYYNQRANTAINDGQWSRPPGTLSSDQNAVLLPADYILNEKNPLAVSERDYPRGQTYDMTGGWYDAGDYGKYVKTAAATLNTLLFAYEQYPDKFASIRGTQYDIPGILEEAKWAMDWFQKMQDAKSGGVFHQLTSRDWEKSPYDIQTRYLGPLTTHDTASYAAVLAQAYRVFKSSPDFEAQFPGYADELLPKAEKAWRFLSLHPTPLPANGVDADALNMGGGNYTEDARSNAPDDTCAVGTAGCPYSDVDERAWAAAELYKTTGNGMYHDAFKGYFTQTDPFFGLYNDFIYDNAKAAFAYVTTNQYPTDSTIVSNIKTAYAGIANEEVANTDANIYRVAYRLDVPSYIGYGAFAQSAVKSFDLIKAYLILGDTKYLSAAKTNLDAELGANPQYRSYITGVGSTPPKNPLHLTSIWLRENSGATDPVPGIPVFGPANWASEGNDANRAVQSPANLYPSMDASNPYPILRRYFDVSAVVEQSEFAIDYAAPILSAFAYFSN